jgi:hypothetical protein
MNINLTREYRHTVGEKLRSEMIDLMVVIYKANVTDNREKLCNLRLASEHIVVVKIYMRLLHDLKQIPLKHFVALSEKTEQISKQTTAWRKSTEEKNRKRAANSTSDH